MIKSNKIKKWIGITKYPITLLILYMVLKRINFKEVSVIVSQISLPILILIISLSLIKIILQYLNWESFLKVVPDIHLSGYEKLSSFFIGTTLRIVSPGGVGVYGRIFYLSSRKRDSAISITYEKLVQSWCLIFFGSIACALYFNEYNLWIRIILPPIILLLPFAILLFSSHTGKYYKYMTSYRKSIVHTLSLQVGISLITIIQYLYFLNSFADFGIIDAIKSVPLVQFANLIPITVSGLGLREYFAITIYPSMGINQELAVACSLAIFTFSNFLPALVGLPFLLLNKTKITKNK